MTTSSSARACRLRAGGAAGQRPRPQAGPARSSGAITSAATPTTFATSTACSSSSTGRTSSTRTSKPSGTICRNSRTWNGYVHRVLAKVGGKEVYLPDQPRHDGAAVRPDVHARAAAGILRAAQRSGSRGSRTPATWSSRRSARNSTSCCSGTTRRSSGACIRSNSIRR